MRLRRRLPAVLLLMLLLASGLPGRVAAQARPRYPVIFIPGIATSELYNRNQLVWIDVAREVQARLPLGKWWVRPWLQPLALKPDGATPASPDYRIRVGSVLRPGPLGVYAGWLDALGSYGYRQGSNLFISTYDWRKGIRDASLRLEPVVAEALRRNPGSGKVILVGHSMGGLIARDYMVRTGGCQVAGLIAAGTPWLGSPIAWKLLHRGGDFGLRIDGTPLTVRLSPEVQKLAQNYPSLYELLPGRHYQAIYRGFVWRSGTPLPYDQALREEIRPRNALLAARAGHGDSLLTGAHYGVRQYLIAGYGQKTMTGAEDGPGVWKERYGDGDEFVPLASADLGASWDAGRPQRFLGPVQAIAYVKGNHTWLMGHARVQRQVRDWLRAIDGGAPLRWGRTPTYWYR
jgi:pimeloyl-ACP methyl ester carboxylesterase